DVIVDDVLHLLEAEDDAPGVVVEDVEALADLDLLAADRVKDRFAFTAHAALEGEAVLEDDAAGVRVPGQAGHERQAEKERADRASGCDRVHVSLAWLLPRSGAVPAGYNPDGMNLLAPVVAPRPYRSAAPRAGMHCFVVESLSRGRLATQPCPF